MSPGAPPHPPRVAAVLLAAGVSRRLGRPKQLLEVAGQPLVRRAAEAALAAGCAPLLVVLGAEADAVAGALAGLPFERVPNPGFEEGIASSIRAGVAAAGAATPPCDGALLLLVDQPRLGAALLRTLVDAFAAARGERIAASAYGGGVGSPAIFPRARFPELLALRGDRGAKGVLEAHRGALATVPFPGGAVDVDTPEDLASL